MIIPIRCMTCGKPVGHLWETYQKEIKRKQPKTVLDALGLERYCCRSLFLTHKEMAQEFGQFKH